MTGTTQMIRYHRHGAPDVLQWDTVPLEAPKPNEVQLRHTAIGVNFLDIYQRSGADRTTALPAAIGVEAVGVVEIASPSQGMFSPGDRVAYVGGAPGAYGLRRNYPANRLIKLPDWIDDAEAAALMFKGLTAEYLIHRCYAVKPGQKVLFHAAAGGVGSIACQWLRAKGATVIGTVGSEQKMEQARLNGCDHVLLSHDAEFVAKLRDLTGGVDVVYDSIGQATFENALDCLRPRGTMVSFGAASGPPPAIALSELTRRGSLFLTRPSIAHYISDDTEYQNAAARLLAAISDKTISPAGTTKIPLREACHAHALVAGRRTTGSVILVPEDD